MSSITDHCHEGVSRSQSPDSLRRWLRIWLGAIAATTALVVVIGGITRLTHSGLSIVEWRPLVGIVPPLSESDWADSFERYKHFPEFQQLRPYMTLAEYKRIFFWEYLHRLLARLIGLVFLLPFAFFYVSGALTGKLRRRTIALFALGAVQGTVGWLMVKSGLVERPSVSHYRLAVHLMLAFAILAVCIWLMRDVGADVPRLTAMTTAFRRTRHALLVLGCFLGLQVVWGAFVAGLKAGFVFNTFPLMGGTLVPTAYWTSSPTVLALIRDPAGVQWMHRVLGTVLVVAAFVLRLRAVHRDIENRLRRLCSSLSWMITTQYALGVLTLVQGVPTGLAVLHQAIAMAIVCLWVCAMHHVRALSSRG